MNKRIQIFPSSTGQSSTGWMVQSDFDGTISLLDVTDTLLNRFGKPGWQELEDAWERGEIGSRECMKGQVALLDMSEAELQQHLDTIEIDAHFAGFVAEAKAHGVKVQVVSDGIDYAIRHVLARHGMADLEVIANHLAQTGERSWRLDSPWTSNHCTRASGNCKCERLAEQQAVHGRVFTLATALRISVYLARPILCWPSTSSLPIAKAVALRTPVLSISGKPRNCWSKCCWAWS